jgi:hypothetical protein
VNPDDWSLPKTIAWYSSIVILFGSFAAYFLLTESLTPNNAVIGPVIASAAFWGALTLLIIGFPLRKSLNIAYNAVRKSGWFLALVPAYLLIHLVIYGILLESILIGAYGGVEPYSGVGVFFTGSFAFTPHSLFNVILSLTVSPSFTVIIPPYFSATISTFAMFTALSIDILVVANISVFMQVAQRVKQVTGSVAVPLIGVVLGAGCCLSIPELVAIASPSLSVLLYTPLGLLAQDVLYYFLPLSVIVILALNLNAIAKVNRNFQPAASKGRGPTDK